MYLSEGGTKMKHKIKTWEQFMYEVPNARDWSIHFFYDIFIEKNTIPIYRFPKLYITIDEYKLNYIQNNFWHLIRNYGYENEIRKLISCLNTDFSYAFCHCIIPAEKGYVWWCKDDVSMKLGRFEKIKIGKLLKKITPYLQPHEIENRVARANALLYDSWEDVEDNLVFKISEDNIAEVYEMSNGRCDSCMTHNLHSSEHPCVVYEYPSNNIGIAYIEDKLAEDYEDKVLARTLINTESTEFVRLYYNEDFYSQYLERKLFKLGYVRDQQCLVGEKIARIEDDEDLILPYFDSGDSVDDYGDYLVIVNGGDILAESENGLVSMYSRICDCCGDGIICEEDEVSGEEEIYCSGCVNDGSVVYAVFEETVSWGYIRYYTPASNCTYSELEGKWYYDNGKIELCNLTDAYGGNDVARFESILDNGDYIYCENDGEFYHCKYLEKNPTDCLECDEKGDCGAFDILESSICGNCCECEDQEHIKICHERGESILEIVQKEHVGELGLI